jgi:hypothetical protein
MFDFFRTKKHEDFKLQFAEDVIRSVQGRLYIGDSPLSEAEQEDLRGQARMFLESPLWEFMKRNIEYHATMSMGKTAKSDEDVKYSSALFANMRTIEEFLQKLANGL